MRCGFGNHPKVGDLALVLAVFIQVGQESAWTAMFSLLFSSWDSPHHQLTFLWNTWQNHLLYDFKSSFLISCFWNGHSLQQNSCLVSHGEQHLDWRCALEFKTRTHIRTPTHTHTHTLDAYEWSGEMRGQSEGCLAVVSCHNHPFRPAWTRSTYHHWKLRGSWWGRQDYWLWLWWCVHHSVKLMCVVHPVPEEFEVIRVELIIWVDYWITCCCSLR